MNGEYVKMNKKLVSILIFVYSVVGFGMTGVPGVSRLSSVSATILAFLLLVNKKKYYVPPWILVIAALYTYLITATIIMSSVDYDVIFGVATVLIGSVGVGIALANKLIEIKLVVYAMLCAAAINVVAIFAGIDVAPDEFLGSGRLTGLLGNSNALAINLSMSAMCVWLAATHFSVPVKLFSLAVSFYGLYVTGSRKGVILQVALLLIIFKRKVENYSFVKQATIIVSLLGVVGVFYNNFENLIDYLGENVLAFTRIFQISEGGDASFSERKWLIAKGYQIWSDNPIFGAGLGQFSRISGFGAYSHNNYIELLVSGGAIALVLYYSLYLMIIYNAYAYARSQLFYAIVAVCSMLFIDVAAVSFLGKSSMLFLVFVMTIFSHPPKPENRMSARRYSGFRANANSVKVSL